MTQLDHLDCCLRLFCGYVSAEQEGIKANAIELRHFIDFIKRNSLQTESFVIGPTQYLVTSIHESWFSARCMNNSKPVGEGAIVMQTAGCVFVALYEGSIGSASRAMAAADQLAWQLGQKSLGPHFRNVAAVDLKHYN
ncbi:Profilin [Quillaja saponaria]|uniref:Profilin n=1 Tax=Quillaja saponaria TaxID=32244 RepID=A0AAD7KQV1_QUISA|nr:Profilin [Quillaja saponaria]